jgi:hypothetical protein
VSYCCSTCGNLDRAGAFPDLHAIVVTYGWDGLADQLRQLADTDRVRDAVAAHEIKVAEAERKFEERRTAERARREAQRQKNRTRQMFRPPYADNMVLPPDALMIQEKLL